MSDTPEEDVREVSKRIPRCARKRVTDIKQRLKAALWFAVGKIVDEAALRQNRNATPQFIGALTEMVWTQIGS